MSSLSRIEQILRNNFQPVRLEIVDDSHKHAGHMATASDGGTHLRIHIVADAFRNQSPVTRHRMIYACLAKEFEGQLHALQISALPPE